MKSVLIGLLFTGLAGMCYAGRQTEAYSDTLAVQMSWDTDTLSDQPSQPRKHGAVTRAIRELDRLNNSYIEPQHYNYTVMLQATHTLDIYTISNGRGQTVTFTPDPNIKVGPYVGWRWFFFGYTFDLKNIGFSSGKLKQEFDLSIYSSQLGVDLFYRKTGSDYKVRDAQFDRNFDTSTMSGIPYDGISAGITGLNVYYIFNHGRFSYPAAFSQSTCQKVSCGSWMAGAGYTKNSLDVDYDKLQRVVDQLYGKGTVELDSGLFINDIRYHNFSLSGGYAYNWVFARNWLFCASAQAALAYKKSSGKVESNERSGFDFENVNLDGIGRFGVVYNNTRWYAGMSTILHTNNYRKSRFRSYNVFGSMNAYVGYNFGLKKKYRKKNQN